MLKYLFKFFVGMLILIAIYIISLTICKVINLNFPPSILGLVLFAVGLITGVIKEDWIKDVSDVLIKNISMFLIPFWAGLIVYEKLLKENRLSVLLVIFVTTALIIVFTGLFVEYGIKILRLHNMRKRND